MKNGLSQFLAYLLHLGFAPTYRGNPYGHGLDWMYFDCFFDEAAVRQQFGLGPETAYVAYDGRAAGQEAGFYDPRTGFGVMGHHPTMAGRTASQKSPVPSDEAKRCLVQTLPQRHQLHRVTLRGLLYLLLAARIAAFSLSITPYAFPCQ